MKLPQRVTVCEVGTRDGFQIEPDFIPTEQKIEVVNRLSATGMPCIEVTSFVSPKAVPQLKDAEAVMAGITRRAGTRYSALVPNDKGAVRAVDAGVDDIHTVVSASESHNLANVNMSIAESIAKLGATAEVAHRGGKPVYAGISCSFGCPFEGEVPLGQLESVVGRLVDLGAKGIGLADTTAMAIPNILAAMEMGVSNFDASIGGLGGCPFAPGASGNVCTEDLVHCLWSMKVETGIDLDALISVSKRVEEIVGRALPGQIVKAGKWDRRYPLPDVVQARVAAAR